MPALPRKRDSGHAAKRVSLDIQTPSPQQKPLRNTCLAIILSLASAVHGDQSDKWTYDFTQAPPMPGATAAHTATVLENGDVLVLGGFGRLFGLPIAVNLARIFDHQQQSWRVLDAHMHYGRLGHGAIRLPDGDVLIAGGWGQDNRPMKSIEIFDPGAGQFTLVGEMTIARRTPRLNPIPNGKVLITGNGRQADIIEPNPQAKSQTHIRPVKQQTHYYYQDHAAVTLPDGSVLLIGGRGPGIERFDPHTEQFHRSRATLPAIIDDQAAILLYDGRVLLAGGQIVVTELCVPMTWIYDPRTERLTEGPTLTPISRGKVPQGAADMAVVDLFADDKNLSGRYILLCGGEWDPGKRSCDPDVVLDAAQIYDARANRFINVDPMLYAHDDFAAVPLPATPGAARVLIIGGYGARDKMQSACEIFSWGKK